MKTVLTRFLRTSIGRRLFMLFAVSALLPLAVGAYLSLTQVQALLMQQGEQRIAEERVELGPAGHAGVEPGVAIELFAEVAGGRRRFFDLAERGGIEAEALGDRGGRRHRSHRRIRRRRRRGLLAAGEENQREKCSAGLATERRCSIESLTRPR